MMIVSACLAGINSRYDGGHKERKEIAQLVREGKAIPLCPEILGGLTVPREPAVIEAGDGRDVLEGRSRVVSSEGEDLTSQYIEGANRLLRIAQLIKCEKVFLKEGSPSCGLKYIYRQGKKVGGSGICSTLLSQQDIPLTGVE
jgi:uncharacterized protein YbbK (DUF523 family)